MVASNNSVRPSEKGPKRARSSFLSWRKKLRPVDVTEVCVGGIKDSPQCGLNRQKEGLDERRLHSRADRKKKKKKEGLKSVGRNLAAKTDKKEEDKKKEKVKRKRRKKEKEDR